MQHAPECERLFGLAVLPAREEIDLHIEVLLELALQRANLHAARREESFPLEVERQNVEHVLDGQVRVSP